MSNGILIDIAKCIGCRSCQVACKQWNNLPAEKTSFSADWGNPPALNSNTYTRIQPNLIDEGNDNLKWRFVKTGCMHCEEPACVSACFVNAFVKTPEGPVYYNQDMCVGCRYCMVACPFWVPKYEWEKTFPLVRKCTGCLDRLKDGHKPACATTCSTGAITFGERKELLQEAKKRIKEGKHDYINHIYGEHEVGGTAVLYISDVPFEKLGFKTDLPNQPLGDYTWKVLSKIPGSLVGWTAILTGVYFFNKRSSRIKEIATQDKEGDKNNG